MDSSPSPTSENVQSKSTPGESTSTNTKNIVVLHTKQQREAAMKHVNYLKRKGHSAVKQRCDDIASFKAMDFGLYNRLDILVDLCMCTILMEGDYLQGEAKDKFTEIGDRKKEVYVYIINMFVGDFNQLFHQLPRNIRKITNLAEDCPESGPRIMRETGIEGGRTECSINAGSLKSQRDLIVNNYTNYGNFEVTKERGKSKITQTESNQVVPTTDNTGGGIVNSEAVLDSVNGKTIILINDNVLNGSYDVMKIEDKSETTHQGPVSSGGNENSSEPEVDVRIQVPKEKQEMVLSKIEEQKDKLEQVDGVRIVETSPGSIIITFTLEKGHVVTEEWIIGILRILFDDILKCYVSEGEIFRVDVQKRVQYTYNLLNDAKIHENCILKTEHLKQIDELRDEIERLRQTEETEFTMMATSTSEAEVQSKSTPDESTSTNPKTIVVLHTRDQRRAANEHVTYLQRKGNSAVQKQCNDIKSFKDMDIRPYSRLDMLVDMRMFNILMMEEGLHEDAIYKYKEIDKRGKELCCINMFQSDFDELLKLIPRNIRKEASHANDYPKKFPTTNQTGMAGGIATRKTAVGAITINVNDWNGSYDVKKVENKSEITHQGPVSSGGNENSDEPKVDIQVSKEKQETVLSKIGEQKDKLAQVAGGNENSGEPKVDIQVSNEKQETVLSKIGEQKDKLEQVAGVKNIEPSEGSIINTFTLEKGHVTEEWIIDFLRSLFYDILKGYVSEGEIDVQKRHLKQIDELRDEIETLQHNENMEDTAIPKRKGNDGASKSVGGKKRKYRSVKAEGKQTDSSSSSDDMEFQGKSSTDEKEMLKNVTSEFTIMDTPTSEAEVQSKSTPDEPTSTNPKTIEFTMMDTSTSEAEVQSKSTPDEPTFTNPKTIVVLHTRDQRGAADEQVAYLRRKGNAAVRKQCNDIKSFKDMDIRPYSRLDMLVDMRMFNILMKDKRLHEDAVYKYEEIDESEKELCSINMFQSDFGKLLNCIPFSIRRETSHAADNATMFPATNSTGMGGGPASGSVNEKTIVINVSDWTGSYDLKKVENKSEMTHTGPVSSGGHKNSGEPKVDLRIQVPKEKQEIVLSKIEEHKDKLDQTGVRDVETGAG